MVCTKKNKLVTALSTIALLFILNIAGAQTQWPLAADSLVVTAFLRDLETQGCPPVADTKSPMSAWAGFSYTLDAAGHFTGLRVGFDLIFKNISCPALPASITTLNQLAALKTLRLVNLGIEQLPAGVDALDNIETLDVSYNHIATMPAALTGMAALKNINLSHNSFTAFDPVVTSFTQLVNIDLSYNRIAGSIPAAIWPTGNRSQVVMDFSYNELSGPVPVPPDYALFSRLNISGNHFTIADRLAIHNAWPGDATVRNLQFSAQTVGRKGHHPRSRRARNHRL